MKQLTDVAVAPPPGPLPRAVVVLLLCAVVFVLWGSQISQAGDHTAAQRFTTTGMSWTPPVPGAVHSDVLRPFVAPQLPWSTAHRGLDLHANDSVVVAPAAGEVIFVGVVVNRPVITIRHASGLLSSFEPVASELAVGAAVAQGQVLGQVADDVAHCAVRCVHWGVRQPDAWHIGSSVRDLYLDPAFLLGWSEPSILWPLHSDPAH